MAEETYIMGLDAHLNHNTNTPVDGFDGSHTHTPTHEYTGVLTLGRADNDRAQVQQGAPLFYKCIPVG